MIKKDDPIASVYTTIARRSLESRVKGEAFSLPRDLPEALRQPGVLLLL